MWVFLYLLKKRKKMSGDLYKQFYYELWKDHKLTKEDIQDWTYAGYFPRPDWEANDIKDGEDFRSKIILGKRHFDDVMKNTGFQISDFYEHAVKQCVCKVKIVWNHIIIEDIKADELNFLILGSECITKFCNISRYRECSICSIKIYNSESGKCKDCRLKRFCPTCDNQLPKGKHGVYCNTKCDPNQCYKCGGKKIKHSMPLCKRCWYIDNIKSVSKVMILR
jgi:hypothetical protein